MSLNRNEKAAVVADVSAQVARSQTLALAESTIGQAREVHADLCAPSELAHAEAELKTDEMLEDLNRMAQHSSMQADVAVMAEQAIDDLKVCQYLEPHIGERSEARVQRVTRGGMQVFLTEFGVSGFLPMRSATSRIDSCSHDTRCNTVRCRVGKRSSCCMVRSICSRRSNCSIGRGSAGVG